MLYQEAVSWLLALGTMALIAGVVLILQRAEMTGQPLSKWLFVGRRLPIVVAASC